MTPCPSCRRHVRDATCPFCGATVATRMPFARAFNTVGGAVTAMVLAACYGTPYKPDDSGIGDAPADSDLDGYDVTTDCDDANADINPGVAEVCDDTVDNNCDGKVDAEDEDCAAK